MLNDDDEISPNYVSELVSQLDRHPEASVAISRQEVLNEAGIKIRQSEAELPEIVSGADFIRNTWESNKYRFACFATFLAKTDEIRACGGYPDFRQGSHNDNALLIKLSLNNYVTFSSKCSFRWRQYEASHGWSMSIWDLAADSRQFLKFLEKDPIIVGFSSEHPLEWKKLKSILTRMAWQTYFGRWKNIYKDRLAFWQWVAAGFVMPPIPAYYREVALVLLSASKMALLRKTKHSL